MRTRTAFAIAAVVLAVPASSISASLLSASAPAGADQAGMRKSPFSVTARRLVISSASNCAYRVTNEGDEPLTLFTKLPGVPQADPIRVAPGNSFDLHSVLGDVEMESSGTKGWFIRLYEEDRSDPKKGTVVKLNPRLLRADDLVEDSVAGRFDVKGNKRARITAVGSKATYTILNSGPSRLTVYFTESPSSKQEKQLIVEPGSSSPITAGHGDIYISSANAQGRYQLDHY